VSNVETVRRCSVAMANRDAATVLELLNDGVEWHQPEPLPWGGTYRGPQEVLEFFAKVNQHIQGLQVDVEEYLDAGTNVVALVWVRGVVRSTGQPLAVRLAHVWKLADGKVVWFSNFVDTAALLGALSPHR
jgi:uncharacterized protein